MHHAVGLGVAAALVAARRVVAHHVAGEARDDRLEVVLLVGQDALLGELQALDWATQIEQPLQHCGGRLAREPIERPAEERLEPALDMQPGLQRAMERQQHGLARWHRHGLGSAM